MRTIDRPILADDHPAWPRLTAPTLQDRTIEHQPTASLHGTDFRNRVVYFLPDSEADWDSVLEQTGTNFVIVLEWTDNFLWMLNLPDFKEVFRDGQYVIFQQTRERGMAKKVLLRDVWMGLAPIILLFANMLIRIRISNYAYVLRLLSKFFSIMLHP